MKLFKDLKDCKPMRKNYKVKFKINIYADTRRFYFAFFPTITFLPWVYRYPNTKGIIDIWWLNFHISLGEWIQTERGGG